MADTWITTSHAATLSGYTRRHLRNLAHSSGPANTPAGPFLFGVLLCDLPSF